MAKVIDITEKLNFEENPKLKIKDVEIEVKTDATTVLAMMQTIGDEEGAPSVDKIMEMFELIFPEESRKSLDDLHLNFADLTKVIEEAMTLVMGDEELGEQ
ncbi:hypothetical protein K6V78_02235 [Streptococcus gallolyticus]|nr:hypothetical protein [Streptococcus gallolyticus]MBY5040458.1 hypothetical protein [Streptococcus gallolyticus]